jgi:uncharacterized membrane protein
MKSKKRLFWYRLFHLYPYDYKNNIRPNKTDIPIPVSAKQSAIEFASVASMLLMLCFLIFYGLCLTTQGFELLTVGKACSFTKRCITWQKEPFTATMVFIGAAIFGVLPVTLICCSLLVKCIEAAKGAKL